MYMREMGSVELLTREGEIEIAKRIEEGLKYMIMAISACPMTVAQILELAAKIERDELKIDDVVDGLMDFNEQLEAIDDDDIDDSEESKDDSGAIAAENLERLKVAALERFAVIRRLYTRMLGVLQKEGHKTSEVSRAAEEDLRRAHADPLRRAPGRAPVRQRALRGRQHPSDRAQDPGPRRQQGRHATAGLHQDVPRA